MARKKPPEASGEDVGPPSLNANEHVRAHDREKVIDALFAADLAETIDGEPGAFVELYSGFRLLRKFRES